MKPLHHVDLGYTHFDHKLPYLRTPAQCKMSAGINPKAKSYYLFDRYAHLSSGLACGLAGLSAGMAIGIVGDVGVRANAQPKLFVGMILILIFAATLALYGFIFGIILSSRAGQSTADSKMIQWLIFVRFQFYWNRITNSNSVGMQNGSPILLESHNLMFEERTTKLKRTTLFF
ncbi:unnamed protein product [Lactuca saligna]|uniref:V-ATPase proteolipid subunit C-like domain-containing protein n=1 Tax=Lactuca saligna TaxID=75948 RepID=A0AA35YN20_LACSI|nr:unnamed protein product [Lactuca saligna]